MGIRAGFMIAAACAVLVAPDAARADIFTTGLYTVINYAGVYPDFSKVKGLSTPPFLDGVEADVGWRFNRYYSVEASYDYNTGSKDYYGTTFNATLQSASFDALGYLPLGSGSAWALYGDVGASGFFAQAEISPAAAKDETRFGGRAGGGLQYQFSDDLGLRISGRYEWMDLSNLKSGEIFAVGLVWQR